MAEGRARKAHNVGLSCSEGEKMLTVAADKDGRKGFWTASGQWCDR
jgi:hypothetical protein